MHSEKGKDLVFLLMQKKGNVLGRKNRFVFLGIFNVFQLDDIVLPDENHPQQQERKDSQAAENGYKLVSDAVNHGESVFLS
jgi:hypothetical protein